MCLLSEWDENKPRNCDICPGRKEEMSALDEVFEVIEQVKTLAKWLWWRFLVVLVIVICLVVLK